jgi:uncharacterized protein YgiM (DUF1202 family)
MRTNLIAGFAMLTAIFSGGTMPSMAEETKFPTDYCYATITATDGYANLRSAPRVNAKIIGTIYSGKKVEIVSQTDKSGKRWYRTASGSYLRANQATNVDCGNF